MRITIAVGAALVLLVNLTWPAFAENPSDSVIHSCVKNRNGKARIVDDPSTCKRRESSLSWNAEGPPGKDARPELILVDANGLEVGTVVSGELVVDRVTLLFEFEGVPRFRIDANRHDFIDALSEVFFESTDCSGPALRLGVIDSGFDSYSVSPAFFHESTRDTYVAVPGAVGEFTVRSNLQSRSECLLESLTETFTELIAVPELKEFSPPFDLQKRSEIENP